MTKVVAGFFTYIEAARCALPGYAGRAAGANTIVGKRPAVAGAVGSTALATSPVRGSRVEQDQGATRSYSGKDHSLPDLPASVRPPDHARPQTGQDTDQTRSADLVHHLRAYRD